MKRVHLLSQAYLQAPWRKQFQVFGTYLPIVICLTLVSVVYLSITSRAATIGREIQYMQINIYGVSRIENKPDQNSTNLQVNSDLTIEDLQMLIEDQNETLANLTSDRVMEGRAALLGFDLVTPDQITYITVPGYTGRPAPELAPPPETAPVQGTIYISPLFTESLIDILKQELVKAAQIIKGVQP
jgi:hypothetical protein